MREGRGVETWKGGRGREREGWRRTEREREAGQKHVGEGKWEKVREEGERWRERRERDREKRERDGERNREKRRLW